MKGLIIAGEYGSILCRQKADAALELGELLVADAPGGKMLLQVVDLLYGSQLTQQALELVSGLRLEEGNDLGMLDGQLRNYTLAKLKSLAFIGEGTATLPKRLPRFFANVREVAREDLAFLATPDRAVPLGWLRSGTRVLDVPVQVDGLAALSHHVLITGTTGRGKSVLMSNLLWDLLSAPWAGLLVLDPHDEYYGQGRHGLKDHPLAADKLVYYTSRAPPSGGRQLRIALAQLHPRHFDGVMDWSDPQREALLAYHREYHNAWIEAALTDKPTQARFHEGTIGVVKRRLAQLLDLTVRDGRILCNGVFHDALGKTTVDDIVSDMERAKLVVVDTSAFNGAAEILIGSIIAGELLDRRRQLGFDELTQRPAASIVLEEAPRVLGHDVLERGPNVFASIAREGRKFRVGLIAITQLPSLIPKEILANLNTKLILGLENKAERQAIIDSAPQDLSADDRAIAALDKGEAIATSTFLRFAMPLRVPDFTARVRDALATQPRATLSFAGIRP